MTSPRRASAWLPASVTSPRLARELIRRVAGPEHSRIALIVTELVTNAVSHGRGALLVSIEQDGVRVRIEVFDDGPGGPVVTEVDASATSGRGVAMVAALADRWGVDRWAHGKTVWAEVAMGPTDGP